MKRVAQTCVAIVIWCVTILHLTFWAAVILSLGRLVSTQRLTPVMHFAARAMLRTAGVRVRVLGLENLPRGGAMVLMSNHVNMIDPFMVTASFPLRIVALERSDHFSWPIYGPLIRRWGNIPVHMDQPSMARTTIRAAQKVLREGYSVMVYPEGTRTRTGQLGPFRKGAFFIAQHAGADIVPFSVRGSYSLNRKNSLIIRPGTITIVISPPLPAAEWRRRPLDELMEATRVAIARHLD